MTQHMSQDGSGGRRPDDRNRNESEEKPKKEIKQLYSREKFEQIMEFTINSGILEDLNYDPVKIEAFVDRLAAELRAYCEEQRASLNK